MPKGIYKRTPEMKSGKYIKTEEHRKNLSKALTGKHLSKETRIKISLHHRNNQTEETRKRISITMKKYRKTHPIKKLEGINNPNWKGGCRLTLGLIANRIYRVIHPIVICEKCGSSKKIVIHHKDRNRRNNDINNLQAFCNSCHLKLHSINRIYIPKFCEVKNCGKRHYAKGYCKKHWLLVWKDTRRRLLEDRREQDRTENNPEYQPKQNGHQPERR